MKPNLTVLARGPKEYPNMILREGDVLLRQTRPIGEFVEICSWVVKADSDECLLVTQYMVHANVGW